MFTEREEQILNLVVKGLSDKAIADKLYISQNTVEKHITHIYEKLDIKKSKDINPRALLVSTIWYKKTRS